MKIKKTAKKILNRLKAVNTEHLLYRVIPHFTMEALAQYFRLKIEGQEHIPTRGPVIFAPNHSGYSGFDALILTHQIQQATGRVARVFTHRLWFANQVTAVPAQKLGFIPAKMEKGLEVLRKKQSLVIFPEGESGNFKPTSKAYDLQPFKRGFILMAIKAQAPIVPVLIIGAEETHINLSQLKLSKYLPGLVLPLPLNIIPLPAKWKIRFLEPIALPYESGAAEDKELVEDLADEVHEKMQEALNFELANRTSVYF